MQQQAIHHIITGYYKKINKYLRKAAMDFDKETIHEFRVCYKKLRAFFRMLSAGSKKGKLKISAGIKQCYQLAGKFRDLQLQQQRIAEASIQELNKPFKYASILKEDMEKIKLQLQTLIGTKPVAPQKHTFNKNLPQQFTIADFKKYAANKWREVYEIIFAAHFTQQTMHSIRKCLKDIFYNRKLMKVTFNKNLSKYIHARLNESYFNKLLDKLGNFQDKCTAITLLRVLLLKKVGNYEEQLLNKIKLLWKKENVLTKKLLVSKLQDDFKIEKPSI